MGHLNRNRQLREAVGSNVDVFPWSAGQRSIQQPFTRFAAGSGEKCGLDYNTNFGTEFG